MIILILLIAIQITYLECKNRIKKLNIGHEQELEDIGNVICKEYKKEDDIGCDILEQNRLDIKQLYLELEKIKYGISKKRDKDYFFYKKFLKKIKYTKSIIENFEKEIIKVDSERLKEKYSYLNKNIDELLKFFSGNGNTYYSKYRLYTITDCVYKLKEELDFDVEFIFKEVKSRNIYVEFEEITELFRDILEKITFEREEHSVILIEINEIGNELLFEIDTKIELKSSDIKNLINDSVEYKIEEKGEILLVKIKLKKEEKGVITEIKEFLIDANFNESEKIEHNMTYDMIKNGFFKEDVENVKRELNEALKREIEKVGRYNLEKQIFVKYYIKNGDTIVIYIENENSNLADRPQNFRNIFNNVDVNVKNGFGEIKTVDNNKKIKIVYQKSS